MEGSNQNYGTRLCAGALGMALGITWALGILFLGIAAWKFSYGTTWVTSLGSIYIGYEPSLKGILIGTVWGFVDGFIGGFLVAWIYNTVAKCCSCRVCKKTTVNTTTTI